MSRTPVCLVTGFLGSGKTTLLQRLVERYRDRRLVYLVNEFSAADVDGKRLGLPPDRAVSIAGGSIFCRCLVTEFIATLRAARAFFDGAVEGVVIEASGIADPRVFGRMLAETQLDQVYAPPFGVTLVDPGTFLKLLHTLPNIGAQVEAADLVLVNKADLHGEDELARVEDAVRGLNPRARLVRTQHAQIEVDVLGASAAPPAQGEYAPCRDPHYCTLFARPPGLVRWPDARRELDRLADVLYRVKGFVACADGWRYVDWSAGVWTETRVADGGLSELVLIASGDAADRLREVQHRLESGAFASQPAMA